MANEGLQFYVDTLIVETILSDPRLSKQAQSGLVSSLIQKVYSYAHEKFQAVQDSDHKIAMISNFLIPGIFTALGFPVLGFLSKLGEMFFGLDFAKIFSEAAEAIKGLVVGGRQTTSSAVDDVVNRVVSSAPTKPDPKNEEELEERKKMLTQAKLTLRDAQLFKIALTDYLHRNPDVNLYNPEMNIKFAAGLFSSSLSTFIASRHKTTKILIAVIAWIAKAVLAAGGFMVMGDVINSIVGTNSTTTPSAPNTSPSEPQAEVDTANQNIFPVAPGYVPENFNTSYARWVIQSDPSSIDHLLLSWATEIYPGLRGHESEVRSTTGFQNIENVIKAYNSGGPPNITFIPRQWKSRKQVIDHFMNEVATKIKPTPNATPPGTPITPIPNWHPPAGSKPGTLV